MQTRLGSRVLRSESVSQREVYLKPAPLRNPTSKFRLRLRFSPWLSSSTDNALLILVKERSNDSSRHARDERVFRVSVWFAIRRELRVDVSFIVWRYRDPDSGLVIGDSRRSLSTTTNREKVVTRRTHIRSDYYARCNYSARLRSAIYTRRNTVDR